MQHYLIYLLVRGIAGCLSILPLKLLYGLSNLVYLALKYVFKYRDQVITENLTRIFPKKNNEERGLIKDQFYQNFSEMLIESVKGLSLSEKEFKERYQYENPELLDILAQKHGGLWLLGGHYANWEWGVQTFPLWVDSHVIGIYKPLKNKYLNHWLQQKRCRFGLELAAMAQVGRHIINQSQTPKIFVLIADQMPSDSRHAIWADLLGQHTPFLPGPEKLAKRTGLPVAHFRVIRKQRGYYSVKFELLSEFPQQLHSGELTQRYAQAIGETILAGQQDWLWSHRRWKWS